jgi:4-carboxymuconolactone decarboxylase
MNRRTRIEPLAAAEQSDEQRERLAPLLVGPAPAAINLFTTVLRHPKLFQRWQALGGMLLLRGLLPARDREILILRTAANTTSDYEWGQHARIAADIGMSAEEIDRCARGTPTDEVEAALMAAADQLHARNTVDDAAWQDLAERYDEAQLIEIVALVGYYHQVAYLLNALGVAREEGIPGLPD